MNRLVIALLVAGCGGAQGSGDAGIHGYFWIDAKGVVVGPAPGPTSPSTRVQLVASDGSIWKLDTLSAEVTPDILGRMYFEQVGCAGAGYTMVTSPRVVLEVPSLPGRFTRADDQQTQKVVIRSYRDRDTAKCYLSENQIADGGHLPAQVMVDLLAVNGLKPVTSNPPGPFSPPLHIEQR